MGTSAHVLVRGGTGRDLDHAQGRIADLEAKWSRFLATSELSRLNAHAGRPCVVSPETRDIVARAVQAWHDTDGLYDPTVLRAVQAAGYVRSYATDLPAPDHVPSPVPGCAGIAVGSTTVTLPADVALDLGGIGKGYAADLVATALGKEACVNIGGDIRVVGADWPIAIEDPLDPSEDVATVVLHDNAMATTSRAKRRWADGTRHHIVDPRTGAPARTDTVAVTVTAPEAWQAETQAKAAFLRT